MASHEQHHEQHHLSSEEIDAMQLVRDKARLLEYRTDLADWFSSSYCDDESLVAVVDIRPQLCSVFPSARMSLFTK
jgi:hypothetical protein